MARKNNPLLVVILCFLPIYSSAKDRGEALFNLCMSCHGPQGHGNPEIGAPAIAGLPDWYILGQLEKFQSGGRGKHPNDDAGNRMRPMALTLRGDDAKIVAAYVAALRPNSPEPSIVGNIEKGKAYFSVCMACHGPNGDGNLALHAPPLKISNDWYLVHQLMNFKSKIRGSDPLKDPTGAMMVPMAGALPDEQAMKDVITYVQSLK